MEYSSIDWADVRKQFPVAEKFVFFQANNGPLSLIGAKAIEKFIDMQLMCPTANDERSHIYEGARNATARLVGALPEEIALMRSTNECINIVASGLDLQQGDKVLVTDSEHPNGIFPWLHLGRKGVETVFIPTQNGVVTLEDLAAKVDKNTKVFQVSAVTFSRGNANDLKALGRFCRERGVIMVVDAMHAVGALPLDVEDMYIDIMASGGQKLLHTMAGIAFLFCSKRVLERITPSTAGQLSLIDAKDVTRADYSYEIRFKESAARFEQGVENLLGMMLLQANIEYILGLGVENIRRRIWEINSLMSSGLQKRGITVTSPTEGPLRSPLVAFYHPKGDELYKWLRENNVRMSCRRGTLRASLAMYNNEADIEKFLGFVDSFQ